MVPEEVITEHDVNREDLFLPLLLTNREHRDREGYFRVTQLLKLLSVAGVEPSVLQGECLFYTGVADFGN